MTNQAQKTRKEIKTCPKHGPYEVEFLSMEFFEVPKSSVHCQKCVDEKDLEQKKIQEEAEIRFKQQKIEWEIENFNKWIPKRFADASIETFKVTNEGQKKALEICNRYLNSFDTAVKNSGGGLIFTGNVGTGKTHLAIGVGRKIAERGKSVIYANLAELIRTIRATWKGDGNEAQILKNLTSARLLIIDEAGVQNGTENERNILFEIIDARYQDVLPTIVISNLCVDEVATFISQRSVDRITHGGAVVPFDWTSQRGVI